MALNYYYGLLQYAWNEDDQSWSLPDSVVSAIDLRPLPAQGTAGGKPQGFAFVAAYHPIGSEGIAIVRAPSHQHATNQRMASAWAAGTGYKPTGDTLFDFLRDQLTLGADPSGQVGPKPLDLHARDCCFHLWFHGQRTRWFARPNGNARERAEWRIMLDRVKRDLRAIRIASRAGRLRRPGAGVDYEMHQRVAKAMCAKYRVPWEDLRPWDWPRSEAPRRHDTTLSDGFNRANESLDASGWRERVGDWSLVSNRASAPANTASLYASYETDLSSSDHTVEATVVSMGPTSTHLAGVFGRIHATLVTGYVARISGASGTPIIQISKVVNSTLTSLDSSTLSPSVPAAVKIECDSDTIKSFYNGAQQQEITDTAITDGLRGGLTAFTGLTGPAATFDDWLAEDLVEEPTVGLKTWRGDAADITHIVTATPANVEIGDIFRLVINGKKIAYTAAAATVGDVVTGLVAAWNDSTLPEAMEITASDEGDSKVTLTYDEAGVPFTVTSEVVDGGGNNNQTLTIAVAQQATGSKWWSNADNWSPAAVPINGDDVVVAGNTKSILYGLDQSAVTLNSLTIEASFSTKVIGLLDFHTNGYSEYREKYLKIGSPVIDIGSGFPASGRAGPARVRIDAGAVQTDLTVYNTADVLDGEKTVVSFKGTHVANKVTVLRGTLSIAEVAGEVATIATLNVGRVSENKVTDADVYCSSGVTLGDVVQNGGRLQLNNDVVSLYISNGEIYIEDGDIQTLDVYGGIVFYNGAGTIDAMDVAQGGIMSFNRGRMDKLCTVTQANLYTGGQLLDTLRRVTWTNGIFLVETTLPRVILDAGQDIRLFVEEIGSL